MNILTEYELKYFQEYAGWKLDEHHRAVPVLMKMVGREIPGTDRDTVSVSIRSGDHNEIVYVFDGQSKTGV